TCHSPPTSATHHHTPLDATPRSAPKRCIALREPLSSPPPRRPSRTLSAPQPHPSRAPLARRLQPRPTTTPETQPSLPIAARRRLASPHQPPVRRRTRCRR